MIEPTRARALQLLAEFLPRAERAYRATRNEDRGPADRSNVSMLAPYVRARLVTEEEVLRAVLARHSLARAEKFIQEIFWRTYWKGWLESRPAVWRDYLRDLDVREDLLRGDGDVGRAHAAATAGETGIPAFDAWSKELVEYGYLHNHARMWFASIWIFTLRLPWELGADFFMRHLLCGDPAANTLSWRWVAGLQTRGKTYRATRDNIRRYTLGRLDAGPNLATRAEAIAGRAYAATPISSAETAPASDAAEPAMLLLHDDDVGVDTLPLHGANVAMSCGLVAARGRSPHAPAASVIAFARGAVADGLARAPFGEPGTVFDAGDPNDVADALAERARARAIRRVLVPYAPVGPVRDALDALEPLLAARDIRTVVLRRAYDDVAWPHATRGFFNLKAQIPSIVRALSIEASG